MNITKIYVFSEKQFGEYLGTDIQSGYEMHYISVNGIEKYYYPNDTHFNKPMKNRDLWDFIDSHDIPKGMIFIDQDGLEFIFTGNSLQIYQDVDDGKYHGCCKGDIWLLDRLVGFDEEMIIK